MTTSQVYIADGALYPEQAAELMFETFGVPSTLDAMRDDKTRRVAVLSDETVVGFIAWRRAINYLYWDLSWIATSGDYHGKGVGRLMVDHMKAHVVLHNGSAIRVETPEDSEACKFYVACGFDWASSYEEFYEPGKSVATFIWRNPCYATVEIELDD